jgi:hyperosmotically inducible protein
MKESNMFKRMSVGFLVVAFALTTAGYALAQGDAVADAATTAAVKTKLVGDTKVGGLGIDVDTKDNVVTLTGKVRSAAEKAEAVRLARTTTGVKNVVDKLVVDPTHKGVTDKDNKAKAEAKEESREAAGTAGHAADKTKAAAKGAKSDMKSETKEAKAESKEKAADAKQASKNAGEKTKDATSDAALTSAVKTKLLADTKVGGLKIDVDTKDNIVTLSGTVSSQAEKAEAVRLAKTTSGVKSVVDKLVIK